ncbi:hypothetical protein EI94DRAFT_1168912 [Lactarius quietus]|nr:hypothetical protein EI94DRAFT_1168912 [Lactarius quietus]
MGHRSPKLNPSSSHVQMQKVNCTKYPPTVQPHADESCLHCWRKSQQHDFGATKVLRRLVTTSRAGTVIPFFGAGPYFVFTTDGAFAMCKSIICPVFNILLSDNRMC